MRKIEKILFSLMVAFGIAFIIVELIFGKEKFSNPSYFVWATSFLSLFLSCGLVLQIISLWDVVTSWKK